MNADGDGEKRSKWGPICQSPLLRSLCCDPCCFGSCWKTSEGDGRVGIGAARAAGVGEGIVGAQ
jgi:hypothetical protein